MDFEPIFKLAETTHGRNDLRLKQPTKIGQIDSPQNKAETTQAEMTRPKRPTAKTTRIRRPRVNSSCSYLHGDVTFINRLACRQTYGNKMVVVHCCQLECPDSVQINLHFLLQAELVCLRFYCLCYFMNEHLTLSR